MKPESMRLVHRLSGSVPARAVFFLLALALLPAACGPAGGDDAEAPGERAAAAAVPAVHFQLVAQGPVVEERVSVAVVVHPGNAAGTGPRDGPRSSWASRRTA